MSGELRLLAEPFVLHGIIVGTAVAVLCGLAGYFVVLRGQVFAGDALSHVSYTGAVAALAAGVDLRFGLFAATLAVGGVLALLGGRGSADDVVIGTTFAWILGLGVLALSIYSVSPRAGDGSATVAVLFGSVFGLSTSTTVSATVIAGGLVVVVLAIARPLLFASVDPAVAAARGVPVRLLGLGFLLVVGATAAEITQVVGAVLLLGLLAAPPAAAMALTASPWRAMWLSVGIAVGSVLAGIVIATLVPVVPASTAVIGLAASSYLAATAASALRRRARTPAGRPVAA